LSKNNTEYNLYRIPIENLNKIIENLVSKQFVEKTIRSEMFHTSLEIRMFFCEKDNPQGYPWVSMLDNYCEEKLCQDGRIYGAVLFFYNSDYCYAASYGNAHFYMTSYCDNNFGIDVAEKLMDLNSIRGQQNLSHGGRMSKSHTDYRKPVPVNYKSGDIPSFLQGMSNNYDRWGGQLICANSIQVKWEENIAQLPHKLAELENTLNHACSMKILPRMHPLKDEKDGSKIIMLNQKLIKAIEQWDQSDSHNDISVPTFFLIGTKIMQSNASEYTVTCNHKSLTLSGDLAFAPIIQFWRENSIPLDVALLKTNVRVEKKYTVPLKELIEFTSIEDHCCLRLGKWYEYNQSFLSELYKSVDRIPFRNHYDDDYCFCKDALLQKSGIKLIKDKNQKVPYETLYNNELAGRFHWDIIHPSTEKFEENDSMRHEICDLLAGDTLYFVKIGSTGNFAEAVDQANQTLEKIARNDNVLTLEHGDNLIPSRIVLLLVYSRDKKKVVKKLSDINSLNFLLHLDALDRFAKQLNIQVEIDFVYEQIKATGTELVAV